MKYLTLFILFLFTVTLADDITLKNHVRPEDIEYIQFEGSQIFSTQSMKAICKTVAPDDRRVVRFDELRFVCFTDLENAGFKLTNESKVECVVDDSTNEFIHVTNPVRDNSCVLSPVIAAITDEDVKTARAFIEENSWICKENDCNTLKVTMYDMVSNHVKFESQIKFKKHQGTFYFLKDLGSFLWAHQ